ncbi:uncharacterized protein A4U43_C05F12420 [Asparagus officinalis]|uniref:Cullin family profile domain-containing protein n=1 Tax=Asparagus officinalis TaxID=4686 RepID=A0A5P1EVH6_ASPOF|nr:uncharacterized protein A4U43_C05F12420 [Asparagus officinalis]
MNSNDDKQATPETRKDLKRLRDVGGSCGNKTHSNSMTSCFESMSALKGRLLEFQKTQFGNKDVEERTKAPHQRTPDDAKGERETESKNKEDQPLGREEGCGWFARTGETSKVFVRKIIELHDEYLAYVQNCFQNHSLFHKILDLTLAKENQTNFEEYLRDNKNVNPGIDLTVNVLTTGFWPTYKSFDLSLPAEMVPSEYLTGS